MRVPSRQLLAPLPPLVQLATTHIRKGCTREAVRETRNRTQMAGTTNCHSTAAAGTDWASHLRCAVLKQARARKRGHPPVKHLPAGLQGLLPFLRASTSWLLHAPAAISTARCYRRGRSLRWHVLVVLLGSARAPLRALTFAHLLHALSSMPQLCASSVAGTPGGGTYLPCLACRRVANIPCRVVALPP
jgi:hypothetical protein